MRYFKTVYEDSTSIWKLREDGKEKCIASDMGDDLKEFGYWFIPDDKTLDPITECQFTTEISEEEAVLEAI